MRQRTAGVENYHSSLQLGWPEVGRRLVGREGREGTQSQAQSGDDKSPLCLGSPGAEGTRDACRAGMQAFHFGEGNWLEARPREGRRERWETQEAEVSGVPGRALQSSGGPWGLFNMAAILVWASQSSHDIGSV